MDDDERQTDGRTPGACQHNHHKMVGKEVIRVLLLIYGVTVIEALSDISFFERSITRD